MASITRTRPLLAFPFILLLGGCSLFGIRTVEEAGYTLVESSGDIEIRDYTGYVTVETRIDSAFDDAGNTAFRKLFGYISGENRARLEIDMTAPVITREDLDDDGETIEMTAPVIASEEGGGWRYAFVLPARFTLDEAPLPLRDDVELVEVAPRRVAVLTFSGSWSESAFRDNLQRLNDWIDANQLQAASGPSFAGYDPPWTLPFLRRNEILIELES